MFRMLRFCLILAVASVVVLSCGCGSSGSASSSNDNAGGGSGNPQLPGVSITADKMTSTAGDLVTLNWSTTNAKSLTITPPVSEDALDLTGTIQVAPLSTTTYTATATNSDGSKQAAVTISVTPAKPTITFTASPESINAGQTSELSWSAQNATSITIDNNVGTFTTASGSAKVTPSSTTTYTATVTGAGGSAAATATVTVAAVGQLGITLAANPVNVSSGRSSTLEWTSQNAVSVSITDLGSVNLNGSAPVTPSTTKTYTATATDVNGTTKTATATVTVLGGSAGLSTLKHIIFYMQENRSFDNYFGMLGQYRQSKGLPADADGIDVNKVLTDYYGHEVKPFHTPTTCIEVTSPGWNESHFFAHRKSNGTFGMDFWMMQQEDSQHSTVDPHYTRSLGYYDQSDIPYYYELATQFATSDRWFASLMGPTIPNRMYLFTGTSFGFTRPDSSSKHPPYTQKTLFQALNEAGVTWRYYYQSGDVYLAQFDIWNDPASQGRVRNISEYFRILSDPKADQLLPQVVFLEQAAGWQLNEHPDNKWGLQPGVFNTKKMIDALMASAAWPTWAFILTYDEGGGLYEHVAPFAVPAPDGTPPNLLSTDIGQWDMFTDSGFRTPVIVVSPWAKKNFVSHTPRTTASILKLIETRFNVPPLTARDAAADDMSEFFDFANPSWMTPPPMPEQPWWCNASDANDATCKTLVQVLGPPTAPASTCDLSHKTEVSPGHPVGP
ncbi:MAG TPA: alkaline phosphatase family protein [Clostridia bacterium]|nr:alkaline phosphatase family protein [Clostridia bacterium]